MTSTGRPLSPSHLDVGGNPTPIRPTRPPPSRNVASSPSFEFSPRNLLRAGRRHRHGRDIQPSSTGRNPRLPANPVRPARGLMQDFHRRPAVSISPHARAMQIGRRSQISSARPGPPRHPQRDGRRIRHAQGVRAERRARISAQHGALPVPQMGRGRVRQFRRRPARHRHLPPGQSRIYRSRNLEHARGGCARRRPPLRGRPPRRGAGGSPDRREAATAGPSARGRDRLSDTLSAPTATPPWSTALASWAGASAGSRRRPRCSASRSR